MFAYCQNLDCGVYLGSQGDNKCLYCNWCKEVESVDTQDDIKDQE